MTFAQAAKTIGGATDARALFGEDSDKALGIFRRLSKAVHPDQVAASERDKATALFATLSTLWATYNGSASLDGWFTLSTRRRSYAVSRASEAVTIANLYPCTWMEDGVERRGEMKIPRQPRDADLMQAEAVALKAMGEGEEKFRPFVPELVESFRHRDATTKVERRVNVTAAVDGLHTMEEVRRKFPHGLDHRDAAWMFRRLLVALGFAHDVGYVHGAVLPQNIYIHPEEHGLVLSEWCFSVSVKQPMKAFDIGSLDFYPPEVMDKEPVSEATDLYMAAKTLEYMVGQMAPVPLRAFIRGCTLEWESMKPHSAWDLRNEYDDLIERLYGPRRFRPFEIPA